MNVGRFESLLKHAQERGVDICADFIIGLPGESLEDIENTLSFSLNLDVQFASFNIATPSPGSSIRRNAIEDGRIDIGDHHYDSFGRVNTLSQVTELKVINSLHCEIVE